MPAPKWLKTRLAPIALLLLAVLLFLVPTRWHQESPECPHTWNFKRIRVIDQLTKRGPQRIQTLDPDGTMLSAAEAQTNVPEFNDCQRLVIGIGDTARYDSLYAVYARDSIETDSTALKMAIDSGLAVPLVEVLSIGGNYEPLKLIPGLSCVYVFRISSEWRAILVPFATQEGDCRSVRNPSALVSGPHHPLAVQRTTNPDLHWGDYPAVARWDWDVRSNTQVIGFKCLDGWCEVGEDGHVPDTGPDLRDMVSSIPALAGTPQVLVKGWYDQQRLSPAVGNWWHPGAGPRSVVGTIIPAPGLGMLDETKDFADWRLTEYVNLSEASTEYQAKQGFVPMIPGSLTTIWFCEEDWKVGSTDPDGAGCSGITSELRQAAKCPAEVTTPDRHWWARTMPADGSPIRYWCIVRRTIKGVTVPGTARWRWLASDETTWGRCGGGCCSGH